MQFTNQQLKKLLIFHLQYNTESLNTFPRTIKDLQTSVGTSVQTYLNSPTVTVCKTMLASIRAFLAEAKHLDDKLGVEAFGGVSTTIIYS